MTKTASKTETHKFIGKALWAKIYEADEFRGSSNFKIDIEASDSTVKAYKSSGIQGKIKENENGSVLSFKRAETKLIKGQKHTFAPPKVYDKDGNVLVEYKKNSDGTGFERVGTPVLIGNGSEVELTVSVYDTAMGKGQRLESVKIIDLIEYAPSDEGFSDRIVEGESTDDKKIKTPWE